MLIGSMFIRKTYKAIKFIPDVNLNIEREIRNNSPVL